MSKNTDKYFLRIGQLESELADVKAENEKLQKELYETWSDSLFKNGEPTAEQIKEFVNKWLKQKLEK